MIVQEEQREWGCVIVANHAAQSGVERWRSHLWWPVHPTRRISCSSDQQRQKPRAKRTYDELLSAFVRHCHAVHRETDRERSWNSSFGEQRLIVAGSIVGLRPILKSKETRRGKYLVDDARFYREEKTIRYRIQDFARSRIGFVCSIGGVFKQPAFAMKGRLVFRERYSKKGGFIPRYWTRRRK